MNRNILIGILVLGIIGFVVFRQFSATGVRGNGDLEIRNYDIGNFTLLNINATGDVIIEYSDDPETPPILQIEAESNLLDYFVTDNDGSSLQISVDNSVIFQTNQRPTFYLTVNNLTSIITTNASVNVSWLTGDMVRVISSGFGDITIDRIEADEVDINTSGGGDIFIGSITVTEGDLTMSGIGDVTLSNGTARRFTMRSTGDGNLNARDFEITNADVAITGTGLAELQVTNNLDAELGGSGHLRYRGDPEITELITENGRLEPIVEVEEVDATRTANPNTNNDD